MDKRIKILVLEDNPYDVEFIERVLRKDNLQFLIERVDTKPEFNHAIKSFEPDIVLSDHGLPQFNSIDALKICSLERPTTPFILVTGTVSDDFAIKCLKQGADDYILKSNLSRLPSAIRRAIKERKIAALKKEAKRRLRKQNNELVKVNKELDNFVYSISHNLRGPLASVLGLLNLAEFENPESLKRLLHLMRVSVIKLDETIKDILDYSKNVHDELQNEKIDWSNLINNVIKKLDYLIKDHPITWNITIKDEIDFFSDRNRLEVVFNNILSNAIQYRSVCRDLIIDIQISIVDNCADIIVNDNSIGIKEDIMPKIFNMFYRGNERSTGSGLGLYIAREALKKLSGDIGITSKDNVGTCVHITVPNTVVQ